VKRKTVKKRLGVFLSVLLLLFLLIRWALYDGLTLREYAIESPLVTGDHTYAVLTDLHSTYYGEKQEILLSMLEKIAPEAIFLVGDIADDKEERQFGGTAVLLEQIADRYPCYYVTGNHERWLDYTADVAELFCSYGVTVLRGDSVDLGSGIRLHGLDDPLFYESRLAFTEAVRSLPTSAEQFDILLSHRPEYAEEYAEAGLDLTLCGHAHGGQIRIPLILNGLYAPNQGWLPAYAGGRYDFGERSVIVSRGMMIDELPRVFNPPELVVIRLTENEK